MDYFGGIDVSLEQPSVCVVDGKGRIVDSERTGGAGRLVSRPGLALIKDRSRGRAVVTVAVCRAGGVVNLRMEYIQSRSRSHHKGQPYAASDSWTEKLTFRADRGGASATACVRFLRQDREQARVGRTGHTVPFSLSFI